MGKIDRERLRALLKERQKSARAASLEAGLGATAVKDILSGKSRDPGAATLAAIATVLGIGLNDLLSDETSPRQPLGGRAQVIGRRIPVMGEVAAGLWREAAPKHIDEADEFIPVDVEGYERTTLYALKVVGPSMDLVYAPGRFVVVAPCAEAGIRVGDYVIVERHRAGLVEVTIKEVGQDGGKVVLRPRSSHPDFQLPLVIDGDPQDQDAPKIIGVVVADFGRRERPAERLQLHGFA